MEFKKVLTLSNGSVEYILFNSSVSGMYGFFWPSYNEPFGVLEHRVTYERDGVSLSRPAATLADAISDYETYLYTLDVFKPANYHGGVRSGAGRKSKPPTKPVRLTLDEQRLIESLRTCDDQHLVVKKLIKVMASIELDNIR